MGTSVEVDGRGLDKLIAAMEADAEPIRAAIEAFMKKRQCLVDSVDCDILAMPIAGATVSRQVFQRCIINARFVSGNSEIPIRIRV